MREARQREEESRAASQARQQPKVEAEQAPNIQQRIPSEAPQSIAPTVSPGPAKPIWVRFPLLRLGLAFSAAAIVFILGWSLIPKLSARDSR
jgi:hypothetical protein